jgi:hypothetical protein
MMKHAGIMLKVSEKTGIAPDICEQIVRTLEQAIQEELGHKPGIGVLNRIAGFVQRMTSSGKALHEHNA